MSSDWCVYHLRSHGTFFMLRASEAEIVVIVIVVSGSRPRRTSKPRRWLKNLLFPHVFALLIVTNR